MPDSQRQFYCYVFPLKRPTAPACARTPPRAVPARWGGLYASV
jgi:hypothetical protein